MVQPPSKVRRLVAPRLAFREPNGATPSPTPAPPAAGQSLAQPQTSADSAFAPDGSPGANGDAEPVGVGEYVVRSGDCMSSIARNSGHFWESLWHDPANSELKAVRIDPNVLMPTDRVFVPPLRPKSEPGVSELRHRFVRRGEPAKIRMVLKKNGKPRANEPYKLEIDGMTFNGTLDSEGKLERPIPGNAQRGLLTVGEGKDAKEFKLNLGKLEPIDSIAGVKARLNNIGCGCGPVNAEADDKLAAALRKFQKEQQLPVTGELDEATRQKVKDVHGY